MATIGTTFGSVILSHLVITFLSQIKAKQYSKIEGSINDRKSKKEIYILEEDDEAKNLA